MYQQNDVVFQVAAAVQHDDEPVEKPQEKLPNRGERRAAEAKELEEKRVRLEEMEKALKLREEALEKKEDQQIVPDETTVATPKAKSRRSSLEAKPTSGSRKKGSSGKRQRVDPEKAEDSD